MDTNSVGGAKYFPNRVLIVDGDIKFMESVRNALEKESPGIEVTILQENELDSIAGQNYDIFIIDDRESKKYADTQQITLDFSSGDVREDDTLQDGHPAEENPLMERIRRYLPEAAYALVSTEQDRITLARRAVDATTREGAIHYLVKPEQLETTNSEINKMVHSMLLAYSENERLKEEKEQNIFQDSQIVVEEMINEGPQILSELEDMLMVNMPKRSSLVKSMEEQFDTEIGRAFPQFYPDETTNLDSLLGSSAVDHELERAILCKKAIVSFYDRGNISEALDSIKELTQASVDDKDVAPARFIRAQIMDVLSRVMAEESNKQYEAGLGQPTSFTEELLEQVESNVTHFNLKKPIRPTRGKVAVVNIGDMNCYRREDPDEGSIRNEVAMYRFYRRIARHLESAFSIMQIPDVLGVVKSHDGSGWSMYRQYIRGVSAFDELMKIDRALSAADKGEGGQKEEVERMKALKARIISGVVKQCANVLASGPVALAENIDNPLENYYLARLEDRILNPFNRLFLKAGVPGISVEERESITRSSMPIHEMLANLEPVFYKDSWYANSVLVRRGRGFKMYVHDFASVKKLPIVIDLATALCYGGFASKKTTRKDSFEHMLVEHFMNEYSDAVDEFNAIVREFEADRNGFILDEIRYDIGNYPSENPDSIKKFYNRAKSLDFRNIANAFGEIRRAVREGELDISLNYAQDLETLAKNMKPKEEFDLPSNEMPEYQQMVRDFTTDYYAALFHRSLLMAGTFSNFILSRLDSSYSAKRRILLQEMNGTLAGAVRGAHNFYTSLETEEDYGEHRKEAMRFVRSLQKRVSKIYKGKLL